MGQGAAVGGLLSEGALFTNRQYVTEQLVTKLFTDICRAMLMLSVSVVHFTPL